MSTERKFTADKHSFKLLSQLNRQRLENKFCDVILAVNEKKFPAHRNVLSAGSDYFCTMFNTNMKEKLANEVDINLVKPVTMQSVLEFLYSSDIVLTEENVGEILEASSLMQIMNLLDVVIDYLSEVLNAENCLYFWKLGRLYSLDKLVEEANQCILKHFEEVSSQSGFNDFEINDVEQLLASDKLMIKFENTTFKAALSWVNKDLVIRKDLFPQLFRHVRLQHIPFQYLANNIRKDKLVREYHVCRDLIEDAIIFHVDPGSFKPQQPRLGLIPDNDSVICITNQSSSSKLSLYKVDDQQWTNLQGPPQLLSPYDFAIASCHQTFAFCGGSNKQNISLNTVVQFNGGKWENLPAMNNKHVGASAVYVERNLFVFGGENAYHNNQSKNQNYSSCCTNNFEVLIEKNAKWKIEGILKMSRAFAAAVVIEAEVYLFGGFGCPSNEQTVFSRKPVTDSTHIYNTSTKQWRDGPNMCQARASFGAVLLNSRIYAFGGYTTSFVALNSFEIMDTACGVWTLGISNLPEAFAPMSACCVKKKIFVADEKHKFFAEYDPLSGKWITRPIPQHQGVIAAVAWKTFQTMASKHPT